MKEKAIGIFDSGIGGLTVLSEIRKLLPDEKIIYYADNANLPYGNKTPDLIKSFCFKITSFLVNEGAELIVMACNTASTLAVKDLRKEFPNIEFVAMEPALKLAVKITKSGKIGILATENTLKGKFVSSFIKNHGKEVDFHLQAGPGLAELIDANDLNNAKKLLKKLLKPLSLKEIDVLVLGCTHYSLLDRYIQNELGNKVRIIDPAQSIAKRTAEIWEKDMTIAVKGKTLFFCSGDNEKFQSRIDIIRSENNKRF